MFTRISYLAEGAFGFLISLAIAFFGINHRWSIMAALFAMIVGFIAWVAVRGQVEVYQKHLLKLTYITIVAFTGFVWFGLWFHDSGIKFYDNYSRLLLLSPLIFLVVKIGISRRNLYLGFLFGIIAISLQAMTYSDELDGRASLSYHNALAMSNVAGEFLVIASAFFLYSKNKAFVSTVLLSLIFCLLVVVVMTGTKGVWLTVLTIFLLALFKLDSIKKRLTLIGLVALLLAIVNLSTNNMPVKRMNIALDSVSCLLLSERKIECKGDSVMTRAWAWFFVLDRVPDSPLIGFGPQNFSSSISKAVETREISDNFNYPANPHNDFIKVLFDFGLLGLAALIGLYSTIIIVAKRAIGKERDTMSCWGYALLLHVVFAAELGLTQSNFAVASQAFHFAFFTSLLVGLAIRSISGTAPESPLNVRK